ncbi:hypothetical protein LCGC14_0639860 [marine sediment metagenome]|uniref:Uncharacterized protein n=1 Tax=marine sediment metagenome TaxID=412755 RepID=A0A0F9TKX5_9ZZZZ
MPYPGGKHGPGHYVGAAGGGGSFFSSPFVLYDNIYHHIGAVSSVNGVNFNGFSVGILRTIPTGSFDWVDVPDLPLQYFEGLPVPPVGPDWSVREESNISGIPWLFKPQVLGVWHRLSSPGVWSIGKPAASTTVERTSVFELSLTADTSDVLARATLQVIYERP